MEPQGAIAIGAGAVGTAVDRQGRRLYVNDEAANTVTVVDLGSQPTLYVLTASRNPARQGIKLIPDGTQPFVSKFLSDKISVVVVAT